MATVLIAGITLDVIGTVLIAYTVLRVHNRVRTEHQIDSRVLKEMKAERAVSIIGVVLIIAGYVFQVVGMAA